MGSDILHSLIGILATKGIKFFGELKISCSLNVRESLL